MNDTTIGVHVGMRICCRSRSRRSGSRSSRSVARRAASGWAGIASTVIATTLVAEQLAQKTTVTLAESAAAIARSARIVASDFSAAAWSCFAWIASGDFSAAAWSTSGFSSAARSARIAATIVATMACKASMQVVLPNNQLALQALELVKNWSANVNRSSAWVATSNFSSAAGSGIAGNFRSARRTGTAGSDFRSAAWAFSARIASSDFSAAGWIANRGVTAGTSSPATVSTQQSMQEIAAKALSAKAGSQNHRPYQNVPLHRTKSPYVHWVTDRFLHRRPMVELRPISAHEVAAEIALDWRGLCGRVSTSSVDFVSPYPRWRRFLNRPPTSMDRDALPTLLLTRTSYGCRPSHPSARSVLGNRQFRLPSYPESQRQPWQDATTCERIGQRRKSP